MANWVNTLNRTYPAFLFGGLLLLCGGYFCGGLPVFSTILGLEIFLLGWGIGLLPKRILLLALLFGAICAGQILRFDLQCTHIKDVPSRSHLEVTCVTEEPFLTGKAAHDYLPYPSMIRARITGIFQNGTWLAADTPILLHSASLEAQLPPDSFIQYGDTMQLKGVLKRPEKPFMPKTFDYSTYLIRQNRAGVFYTLTPDSVYDTWDRVIPDAGEKTACIVSGEPRPLQSRIMRGILAIRDTFLERMTAGLELPHKRYVASLIFGLKQGLDDLKMPLIQGGLIHLFAVSGLHVGMAALILYLLFFYLPLTTRTAVIIGGLWLYVLTTGMEPAACRAFWMLTLYFVLTARAYRTDPAQAVLLIGGMIIAFSPQLVTDIGFAFSFVLTLLIVLYANAFSHLQGLFFEKQFWQMRSARSKRNRFFLGLLEAYILALLMVIGAAPLTFYMNGYTHVLAWVLNPLLIPGIFLIFGLSLIKIALPLALQSGISACIDTFFTLFGGICDWIEYEFDTYAIRLDTECYSLFGLWILLILILKIRTAKQAYILLGCTAGISLTLLLLPLVFHPKTGDLFLFRGSKSRDFGALVLYYPTRTAYFINPVQFEYERRAVRESAERHGFTRIIPVTAEDCPSGIRINQPETDTPLCFSMELPQLKLEYVLTVQENTIGETLKTSKETRTFTYAPFCGKRLMNKHEIRE